MGSPKSYRITSTELIVPSIVDIGCPIIKTGSYELKAMKHFVTSMGAMHEKQIEAMHIDNIFPEFRQGGLPVPDRVNRSAMRYLFGILAFHQHYHPHQEQCQLPTPPPSSLPPPWPPPLPPYRVIPATWAATARQVSC